MKLTMTPQTGAFAVPRPAVALLSGAVAVGAHRDRRTTGPDHASDLGSTLIRTVARIQSVWTTVDVPTPVPVRHRGAYG